jgi:predicted nucleotide-binding protein
MEAALLRAKLKELHNQGQQFLFENFPRSILYKEFLDEPPAEWDIWVQRICNLVKETFKTTSAPYLLVMKGEREAKALRGNGEDLFNKAKSDLLKGIELCLGAIENDVHGELLTQPLATIDSPSSRKVFIGHGRASAWKDLKDFLQDRLKLPWDEFNRESPAGKSTKERLEEMLSQAGFAFVIMTAEDEHADETLHARENVIHEAGLFQGKIGFSKAIILLEEGCKEFSNIHGLGQIRFPKGHIMAASEEIRRVLEREKLI